MQDILKESPEKICRDILNQINNEEVKIEVDKDSKTSLYMFLNNTIYISDFENSKKKDELYKSRLLVIAHECAHSLQSKLLQIANFILSNVELLLFSLIIILRIVLGNVISWLLITYITIFALGIVVRYYLEINATINSVKIIAKYLIQKNIAKTEVKDMVCYYRKKLLSNLLLFMTNLYIFKILRLVILLAI